MSRCGAAVRFVFPSNRTLQRTNPSQMAASLSPRVITLIGCRISFSFTSYFIFNDASGDKTRKSVH